MIIALFVFAILFLLSGVTLVVGDLVDKDGLLVIGAIVALVCGAAMSVLCIIQFGVQ